MIAGTGQRGKQDGPVLQSTFSLPNGIDASVTGDTLYVNDAVGTLGTDLNPVVVRMIVLKTNTTDLDNEWNSQANLYPNSPNPFYEKTTLSFELKKSQVVQLEIRDLSGRLLETVVDGFLPIGRHEVEYQSDKLLSGMYLYHLKGENIFMTRKMTYLSP